MRSKPKNIGTTILLNLERDNLKRAHVPKTFSFFFDYCVESEPKNLGTTICLEIFSGGFELLFN